MKDSQDDFWDLPITSYFLPFSYKSDEKVVCSLQKRIFDWKHEEQLTNRIVFFYWDENLQTGTEQTGPVRRLWIFTAQSFGWVRATTDDHVTSYLLASSYVWARPSFPFFIHSSTTMVIAGKPFIPLQQSVNRQHYVVDKAIDLNSGRLTLHIHFDIGLRLCFLYCGTLCNCENQRPPRKYDRR